MSVHPGRCAICGSGPRRLWCRWLDGEKVWCCADCTWRLSRPEQVALLWAMREARNPERAEARVRLATIEREAKAIAAMLARE